MPIFLSDVNASVYCGCGSSHGKFARTEYREVAIVSVATTIRRKQSADGVRFEVPRH